MNTKMLFFFLCLLMISQGCHASARNLEQEHTGRKPTTTEQLQQTELRRLFFWTGTFIFSTAVFFGGLTAKILPRISDTFPLYRPLSRETEDLCADGCMVAGATGALIAGTALWKLNRAARGRRGEE